MSRIDKPITFAEADKALAKRQDRETYLKSREIAAQWSAEARSRAFFSARVANATILSELHSKAQAIAQGKMTQQQAKLLLRRYFVGEGAKPLAALGFAPADEAGGVGELGSAQRINLILETNVRMAQEAGQYRKWAEDRDIYKYGIWRVGWSKEHRPEHLARDGRAYAFDHPIWTESPPGGEFNCHCYRQLARESEVLEKGITPEPQASYFKPSSLGFDPSRGMREPPEFGKRVKAEYKAIAKAQMAQFQQEEKAKLAAPELTPEERAAKQQEQEYEKQASAFEQKIIADAEKSLAAIEKLFLPNEDRAYTKAEKEEAKKKANEKIRELAAEFKACYTPKVAKLGKPPAVSLDTTGRVSSQYTRSTNTITLRLKKPDTNRFNDWSASMAAVRHEFGHWLHYEKGGDSDADVMSQIKSAGKEDWEEIRKAVKEKSGIFKSGYVSHDLSWYVAGKNAVELDAKEREIHVAFTDSVGSISNGVEGWGHTKNYYKNQNARLPFGEAVANIYGLSKSIPEKKLKLVFPKLSAIVLDWR